MNLGSLVNQPTSLVTLLNNFDIILSTSITSSISHNFLHFPFMRMNQPNCVMLVKLVYFVSFLFPLHLSFPCTTFSVCLYPLHHFSYLNLRAFWFRKQTSTDPSSSNFNNPPNFNHFNFQVMWIWELNGFLKSPSPQSQ